MNGYQVCACMGPMYGEPYCPCEMTRKGLSMENNPLRIADNEQFAESMKKACEPGGWLYVAEENTSE